MNWELYNISEIDLKWKDWDRLNGLYYNHHPYFDSRFIKPCVKYFGDKTIRLAQLKNENHEIVGMTLVKKRPLGTWTLFTVAQMQIVPILLNPKNRGGELKGLLKSLSGFCWRLECLYQDPDFTPFSMEDDKYTTRYYHCTTTSIELDQTFNEFWNERKKKLRQNIKRYFNRIEKTNMAIKFIKISQLEELKNGLIRYGLLESLGWKGKAGTAIHPDNTQGRFYNDVMQSFGLNGQAYIYEFYFKDELAASRLCINNKEINITLKVTYNENLKKFAPGKLLTYKMIEKEFEEKIHKRIEFYTNASKDQLDWSSAKRNIYHFEVHRNLIINKIVKFKNRK